MVMRDWLSEELLLGFVDDVEISTSHLLIRFKYEKKLIY
jgi:hypothetical protein